MELTTDDDRIRHDKYMVHVFLQFIQVRTAGCHCCKYSCFPHGPFLKKFTELQISYIVG
jgi:hypothetical protein